MNFYEVALSPWRIGWGSIVSLSLNPLLKTEASFLSFCCSSLFVSLLHPYCSVWMILSALVLVCPCHILYNDYIQHGRLMAEDPMFVIGIVSSCLFVPWSLHCSSEKLRRYAFIYLYIGKNSYKEKPLGQELQGKSQNQAARESVPPGLTLMR